MRSWNMMPATVILEREKLDVWKDKKWFVTEASDIGFVKFQQLYRDSCDIGLYIPDSAEVLCGWAIAPIEVWAEQPDSDVDAWILEPTSETLKAHPQLAGWQLHILND